ncbi:ABC transporter substrate-binding protein [Brucella anthropi]|uniref:ABC transporter substrate-binding protein n=1 Tax=Brucella anthropi TaxID=529 RepID=UPI00124DE8F5|nr:ABC transporter substrate-binding protein [Brucella anthropi]KAB2785212.1 ABC transporter substrate-binding protein [Brucella anthropi]QOD67143.1 ABC transporter substrate-binding protein [Ochrobactrum sp. MT180101]
MKSILGNINRRKFLALSGAAGAYAGLSAAGSPVFAQAGGKLVMATGGGKVEEVYRATMFEPWTKKTGVEVVTTPNQGGRLKAMVEQGKTEWDLIQGAAEEVIIYGRQSLLEPIDPATLDVANMVEGSVRDTFVVTDFAAYCVGWNTDSIKTGPKNWKELWAVDGRIGLLKKPNQTLEAALLADGVQLKDLYPLDLDRAFKSLEKIKSKVVWWATGAQGAQMVIDGEVDAIAIWNGRIHDPKKGGAPVDFHFNQAILVSDAWAIPKGAPNKDKAMDLLSFSIGAEPQAAFSKQIPYASSNKGSLALLDDKTRAALPTPGPDNVVLSLDYWADNGAKVTERFNQWLLG